MLVIGMMSGTSGDGVDAALVRLEGQPPALRWELLKHIHRPFDPDLQAEIFTCFNPQTSGVDRLCALNFALGRAYARVALEAVSAAGLQPGDIDLIGSHGQSLWHIPTGPQASTLQMGEAAVIAEETGITTIHNFRTRDMAAGGQGAPLVPLVDVMLFGHPALNRVLLNIGGIANGTYLPNQSRQQQGEAAYAFDTGPGNMLMDDAVRRLTGGARQFDEGGRLAARGTVDEALLRAWLDAEPYFKLRPPKTTGRELFGAQYGAVLFAQARQNGLPDEDILATLTAFTARSIAQAVQDFFPVLPDELVVSGGGALNLTLMGMLSASLPGARVYPIEQLGLGSDAKEAVAFAVLAYESWHFRPGNLPAATGASRPAVLGSITPGTNYPALMAKWGQ